MITLTKPFIGSEEIEAVTRTLQSGHLAQGQEVEKLEQEFADICGVTYAVAVVNGTAALHTALVAAGVGTGDEVITTPFTFVATVNAILMSGAKPVFADIDELTYNIDPADIERKITPNTKAILAVNLYGQPADYDRLRVIAGKHNLVVIEDAAQSVGAKYSGKMSGGLGDIGCFSLYATKNIMSGEGGIVTTNNKEYAQKARVFRNHGQSSKYEYASLGYNYRMTDVLASIARVQLTRLQDFTHRRQETAAAYSKELKNLKGITGITVPATAADGTHVFHQYTLRVTTKCSMSRDELQRYLNEKGIQSGIYYPQSLTQLPHIKSTDSCSRAEKAAREVLSIPVHPLLTPKERSYIIKTLSTL